MIENQTWKRAWTLLLPQEKRRAKKVVFIVVLTALLAAAMVGSIMPFLIILTDPNGIQKSPLLARAYEQFGFGSIYSFLIALGVGALLINVIASIAQIARSYAIFLFSARQIESFSTRLISFYLYQPYAFFLDRHSGDLSTQVLSVSQQAVDHFYKPAAEIIAAAFSALAVLALVFWIAPVVSMISLAVLGGIYGATFLFTHRRIAKLGAQQHSANRERYRTTVEALGGIKALKIRNREHAYVERFKVPARKMAHVQLVSGVTAEVPNYVLQALAFGGIIALGLAILDPGDADSTNGFNSVLPIVGLFAFAGQRLMPELQRIYANLTIMQVGHAVVNALYDDLASVESDQVVPLTEPAPMGLKKDITINGVFYTYPNSDKLRLNNASMTIKAGEKIGVVGKTGAGKSTLADLVLGLIRPNRGTLVIDGVEITEANLVAWRRSLGYVPQDIFLVDGSIRENIVLGDKPEQIDDARVREACKVAQLDAFIEQELPDGYNTMVGERGVRLSGGQRQRIGIARAMYDRPDLLIFDEATSALDAITEKEIISAIEDLDDEKTILIIAHRLATVKRCDRIFVLDDGRIADSGTWDELMAKSVIFQNLAKNYSENGAGPDQRFDETQIIDPKS